MKILHTEASCGWGGQEIRILEEARGLISRGHEVSIACPAAAHIFAAAPRYGVPATALPVARKNLGGLFALRRHLARVRPDLVNTHSSTDSWLAALACATLRRAPPLVRTRHISAPVPKNAASRWLYGGAVCHVVTTGEALRRELIEDFFWALADRGRFNLHLDLVSGRNSHHIAETLFKATARALRMAVAVA